MLSVIYIFWANIVWTASAWMVDFTKLPTIPAWAWLFVLICPVYPFLLALIWLALIGQKTPNAYLATFAVFGSVVFGVLALFYYPLKMIFQGFSWPDLGQIFWVAFYSVQGWYLLFRFQAKIYPAISAAAFLVLALVVNYRFKTFSYLSLDDFSGISILLLFILGLLSTALVFCLSLKKKKSSLF